MNTQELDINRALANLDRLRAKTQPAQMLTMARQRASYQAHRAIAMEAASIVTDFLTEICSSAAELGNDTDSKGIREVFTAHLSDAMDDVFWHADAWVGEGSDPAEDRADFRHQMMKEQV